MYPSTALLGKKSARCGLDPDAPVITTVAMGVDVSGVGGTRVCKDFLVASSWVKRVKRYARQDYPIGLGFKLLLRYDDLTKCRWDPGFCEVFPDSPAGPYIRFFLSGRKNDQYRGSFLDVAAPLNGQRGLYHALLRGKNHFKTGFVLRTVYNDGTPADPEKFLGHGRFVAFLRAALLSIGFASEDVGLFAAHSLRAPACSLP